MHGGLYFSFSQKSVFLKYPSIESFWYISSRIEPLSHLLDHLESISHHYLISAIICVWGGLGPGARHNVWLSYLIFIISFTIAPFKAWKFYTQKCVNLQQNCLATKQRKSIFCVKLQTVCVKLRTVCKNYTLCVKLHTVFKITHSV